MADDRPAPDATEALAQLRRDFEDLKATLLVRAARRPTGTVEATILTAAKADTLLLQGQVVSRATYAGLWQWVQDNSLVAAGLFTVGDGSTTFGLPDCRGRVLRGVAATGESVGSLVGADSMTLTTAQLPAHTHSVTLDGVGDHDHYIANGGLHGGHNDLSGTQPPGTGWPYGVADRGDHNHNMNWNGAHNHTVHETSVGTGAAIDRRQASIAVNWLIWT